MHHDQYFMIDQSLIKPSACMRSKGYSTWSVCVCLSVSSNLTSRVITRPARNTNGFGVIWAANTFSANALLNS